VSEFNQPGNRHALGTIAAVADLVGVIVRTPRAEGEKNEDHIVEVAWLGRGGAVSRGRALGAVAAEVARWNAAYSADKTARDIGMRVEFAEH